MTGDSLARTHKPAIARSRAVRAVLSGEPWAAAWSFAGLLVLACHAQAQSVAVTVTGELSVDRLGRELDGVGDVNGDGIPDFIAGMDQFVNPDAYPGKALVYSGLDGSVLYHLVGDNIGDGFGSAVAGLGDVNGDGIPDFAVGASGVPSGGFLAGSVRVFSGADGSTLYTIDGPRGQQSGAVFNHFGSFIAGAGDVDGDGLGDLLISAWGFDGPAGDDSGAAWVHSGAHGTLLYTFHGAAAGDRFGQGLDGAGDVNGDGYADLVVGSRFGNPSYARIYSGQDGALLHEFFGAAPGDAFGRSVAGAGDLDLDGYDDVVIASPGDMNVPGWSGSVNVFSGSSGELLLRFEAQLPQERSFGHSVDSAGDVDGDGVADIVVGIPLFTLPIPGTEFVTRGEVIVFSGATGQALFRIYGTPDSPTAGYALGEQVIGLGDVNADGRSDVLAGGYQGNGGRGVAHVFLGGIPVAVNYCTAVANSTGRPAEMSVWGTNSVFENDVVLIASKVPAAQNGLFIYSPDQAQTPLGDGNLCLGTSTQGFINRLPIEQSSSANEMTHALDLTDPLVPESLITPGSTWNFQCWFRDLPAGGTGFNFSDAVRITFGP